MIRQYLPRKLQSSPFHSCQCSHQRIAWGPSQLCRPSHSIISQLSGWNQSLGSLLDSLAVLETDWLVSTPFPWEPFCALAHGVEVSP